MATTEIGRETSRSQVTGPAGPSTTPEVRQRQCFWPCFRASASNLQGQEYSAYSYFSIIIIHKSFFGCSNEGRISGELGNGPRIARSRIKLKLRGLILVIIPVDSTRK